MSKKLFSRHVAAIDIGTTKICVLIATVDDNKGLEIIGIGSHPSHGLKKGVIVNIGLTVDSIRAAIKEAEAMAGVKVESACVGISGGHISSFNSTGVVAIKGKEVKQYDIDRVIEAAKAVAIPKDQEILHVLPQYFRIDGQEFVLDSLGMYGVRLEAQVHIVAGSVASAQNIVKASELAGVHVSEIVLEQIASADAVLTPFEREMGAGLLDIGGGTSDFAIYKDGRIRYSKVFPIAGNHFTNDIAVGLGIPVVHAEGLKKQYGTVTQDKIFDMGRQFIDVNLGYDGGLKKIELSAVGEILRFRAEEICDLFLDELVLSRLKLLMPAGVILTGGGCLLDGFKDLLQEITGLNVRVGLPQSYVGSCQEGGLPDMLKSPVYSTVYGLLVYSTGQREGGEFVQHDDTSFGRVVKKMRSWIYDLF